MRDWIVATLALAFLSGGTTGYFLGQSANAPEKVRTWKDGYVEQLQHNVPGIKADDLDRARKILETYEERVLALKSNVDRLLRDQLDQVAEESQREIQVIIDSYQQESTPGTGD